MGFQGYDAILTPLGDIVGISGNTEVIPTGRVHHVAVGSHLLGKVLDGMGRPLHMDPDEEITPDAWYPVYADAPDPLTRKIIDQPLPLGLRAFDGMLTCGEGQRMGILQPPVVVNLHSFPCWSRGQKSMLPCSHSLVNGGP